MKEMEDMIMDPELKCVIVGNSTNYNIRILQTAAEYIRIGIPYITLTSNIKTSKELNRSK